MCFLSVEKSCSPYSSKWFGSHAVSNGQGYRQLRVSVNQPSSLHGQIVRLFPPLSPVTAAMIRYVKRFTSFSNAVRTCKEEVFFLTPFTKFQSICTSIHKLARQLGHCPVRGRLMLVNKGRSTSQCLCHG